MREEQTLEEPHVQQGEASSMCPRRSTLKLLGVRATLPLSR